MATDDTNTAKKKLAPVGDVQQAQTAVTAPRDLTIPQVQPTASGQGSTAADRLSTSPGAAAPVTAAAPAAAPDMAPTAQQRLVSSPQPVTTPGPVPDPVTGGPTITPNPQFAAARQAEMSAARGGAAPVAGSAEAAEAQATAAPLSNLPKAGAFSRMLRGTGVVAAAAPNAVGAVNDAAAGDYTGAAKNAGLAYLNGAAVAAPSPITIGGAVVGQGINALANSEMGQRNLNAVVDHLPGNGIDAMGNITRDAHQFINDRNAASLPVPPNAANRLVGMDNDLAVASGHGVITNDPTNPYAANAGPAMTGQLKPRTLSDLVTGNGAPGSTSSTPNTAAAPAPGGATSVTPDSPGNADPRTWSPGAQALLNSNKAGTAVINGKVIDPAYLKTLENRNVISSDNFTHPGLGTTGTPVTEAQGVSAARNAMIGDGGGPQRLPDLTGGIGAPQGGNQTFKNIASQVQDLIGRGKRRSARIMVDLLNGMTQNQALTTPKPQTGAETALTQAQAENQSAAAQDQGAKAGLSRIETAQRAQIAQVQEQLANTTDPAQRKVLENKVTALSGRAAPEEKPAAAERYITTEFPDGHGGVMKIPVPESQMGTAYDLLTGKLKDNKDKKSASQ